MVFSGGYFSKWGLAYFRVSVLKKARYRKFCFQNAIHITGVLRRRIGSNLYPYAAVEGNYSAFGIILNINLARTGGVFIRVSGAGASYNLDYSRARAYCACSRCGWGLFGHFYSQLSFLSSFSLSLGDGPI